MKFYMETLGCKVNAYESNFIEQNLLSAGYLLSDNIILANIIIINTCSVTNQADAKSRKTIRRARKENPNAILVVCGCSAQNKKEEYLKLGVDILLGNKDKSKIVDYISEFIKNKKTISRFYELKDLSFENMKLTNFNKTRGFIKVQDGCNNYCSYCIIPYLRGNLRSKELAICVDEAKCMVKSGIKEIVLTGIHTGSYKDDAGNDLVDLIKELSKIEGLERIRISSIEATELDEKFMNEFKVNKKICSHMHIPIQSGSNDVLKYMNRKYDKEYFIEKLNELRTIRPDVNITTDLIVGFPNETDECFKETLDTIYKCGFSKIHTFPYSKRDGTPAAKMTQVNDTVKTKRCEEILNLSLKLENDYYQKFLNKEVKVLMENDNKGFTDNYIKVHLLDNADENELINVKIVKIDGTNVYCKRV